MRPHLLTTAIGQAAIAAQSVDQYLRGKDPARRPKVDVNHFDLLAKLNEQSLAPDDYDHAATWGTSEASFAVHNYEDRSQHEIIPSDELFLGHFEETPRNLRDTTVPDENEVLGHFEERHHGLDEGAAQAEAERMLIVIAQHLRYFTQPVWSWVTIIQWVGSYASFAMFVGLVGLWARRVLVDRIRYISAPSDHLMLALLLAITGSGLLMKHVDHTDIVLLKA